MAIRSIVSAPSVDRPEQKNDADKSHTTPPRDQVLDLAPLIHPRGLDKATVRSLLAESLAACNGDQLAALDEPLESLRKAHPEDMSVAITIALQALAIGDSHRIEPAVSRMVELVEKSPLETLAVGTCANSRQRRGSCPVNPALAGRPACATQAAPTLKAAGHNLLTAPPEAAQRQSQPHWVLAMLASRVNWPSIMTTAVPPRAAWSRMLNMVVTPEVAKNQRPSRDASHRESSPPAARCDNRTESIQGTATSKVSGSSLDGPPSRVVRSVRGQRARAINPPLLRPKLIRRAAYWQTLP